MSIISKEGQELPKSPKELYLKAIEMAEMFKGYTLDEAIYLIDHLKQQVQIKATI